MNSNITRCLDRNVINDDRKMSMTSQAREVITNNGVMIYYILNLQRNTSTSITS